MFCYRCGTELNPFGFCESCSEQRAKPEPHIQQKQPDTTITQKEPPKLSTFMGSVVKLVFVCMLLLIVLGSCSNQETGPSEAGAYVAAQDFVMARLKAPGSAKFPSMDKVKIVKNVTGNYRVTGYVDAQNGFGALIRTRYTALVIYNNKGWDLDDFAFIP